jgi:hypothetical protein
MAIAAGCRSCGLNDELDDIHNVRVQGLLRIMQAKPQRTPE